MSNVLFYSQLNVACPDARVIRIPMKTTLYTSENVHNEKQPFWGKYLTLEIELGPLFQGLVYPTYSKLEVRHSGHQIIVF